MRAAAVTCRHCGDPLTFWRSKPDGTMYAECPRGCTFEALDVTTQYVTQSAKDRKRKKRLA